MSLFRHTNQFLHTLVGYGLSSRRGDRNTYFDGLIKVIEKIKGIEGLELILHTDQGSVYSSKSFNEILPLYHITHSMSRAGTPTDNAAMEAINGWAKTEMFIDFKINECDEVPTFVERYVEFFNKERPACKLGYFTPYAYRQIHYNRKQQVSTKR